MAKAPKFENAKVQAWVDKWVALCNPDKVVVIHGDKKEHEALCETMQYSASSMR